MNGRGEHWSQVWRVGESDVFSREPTQMRYMDLWTPGRQVYSSYVIESNQDHNLEHIARVDRKDRPMQPGRAAAAHLAGPGLMIV